MPPGKDPTPKEDRTLPDSTKPELQELKAAVGALKTEVKASSGATPNSTKGEETDGIVEEDKEDAKLDRAYPSDQCALQRENSGVIITSNVEATVTMPTFCLI